jgi:pimeloyl-ACP methyl ester carboxylesterase
VTDILDDQERLADRPWYEDATEHFDNPFMLGFLAGILDHDPTEAMRAIRCPVLALHGGDDTIVPAMDSALSYATNLAPLPGAPHGIAVFPGADHGLFVAAPDPDIPRTEQLAPGFLPMVAGFLADAVERRRSMAGSTA